MRLYVNRVEAKVTVDYLGHFVFPYLEKRIGLSKLGKHIRFFQFSEIIFSRHPTFLLMLRENLLFVGAAQSIGGWILASFHFDLKEAFDVASDTLQEGAKLVQGGRKKGKQERERMSGFKRERCIAGNLLFVFIFLFAALFFPTLPLSSFRPLSLSLFFSRFIQVFETGQQQRCPKDPVINR